MTILLQGNGPRKRSNEWLIMVPQFCHPEEMAWLWQVKKETTLQKSRWEARRAGRQNQPSPEGLGINPEDDLSAVGAALNLGPLPTCSPLNRHPVPTMAANIGS
jgi:hypothetical protein